MTVLTNSQGGVELNNELFADDWALRRFAGITNLPAERQHRTAAALEPYAGTYATAGIPQSGVLEQTILEFTVGNGQLDGTMVAADADGRPDEKSRNRIGLVFYEDDRGLDLGADGKPLHTRSEFVRGPDGAIVWFRSHGRLYGRQ
jgi:hypothetical protein